MLGFSKAFAIVILIAVVFSLGMRSPWIGIQIVGVYAIFKIIWNILTKKN